MASVIKNGQPSMEEILASIRRIVADDPGVPAPLINLDGSHLERPVNGSSNEARVDDSPDFELPSMFRPGQDASQRRAKAQALKQTGKIAPIGRLTDAIRNVAPKAASPAGPEPVRQTKAMVEPDAQFGIRPKANQSLSSLATDTLNSKPMTSQAQTDIPASTQQQPSHAPQTNAAQAGDAVGSSTNQQTAPNNNATVSTPEPSPSIATASPPRVMAPFRDTRMNAMSAVVKPAPTVEPPQQTAAPAANSEPQISTSPAESGIGAIVPGALDLPGRETVSAKPAANAADVPAQTEPAGPIEAREANPTQVGAASDVSSAPVRHGEGNPPPLPDGEEVGALPKIEDATADLLRPMLRQWLSDNMPRMVEKALHIEVAESVRSDKSEDGS